MSANTRMVVHYRCGSETKTLLSPDSYARGAAFAAAAARVRERGYDGEDPGWGSVSIPPGAIVGVTAEEPSEPDPQS